MGEDSMIEVTLFFIIAIAFILICVFAFFDKDTRTIRRHYFKEVILINDKFITSFYWSEMLRRDDDSFHAICYDEKGNEILKCNDILVATIREKTHRYWSDMYYCLDNKEEYNKQIEEHEWDIIK